MSNFAADLSAGEGTWVRFWHQPVRAERLAVMRITLALALLADLLVHYLPNFADFYGPEGIAPAGLYDSVQLSRWRWTYLFLATDNLTILYSVFGLWVAVTLLLLVGWQTRLMNVLCWFLARCFHERNPNLSYGADTVLLAGLFLLMLAPSGAALSLDAWRKRRRGLLTGPAWVPPWSLRLIQIQLCLIYCSTGVAKLWNWDSAWNWTWQSWWQGTAVWFFFQDINLSHRSFAELPVPFWLTMVMTYVSVVWELLFPLLVMNKWTRRGTLILGVMFHIGISLAADIAWFGFYMMSFYGVWIGDAFWTRFDAKPVNATSAELSEVAPALVNAARRTRVAKRRL